MHHIYLKLWNIYLGRVHYLSLSHGESGVFENFEAEEKGFCENFHLNKYVLYSYIHYIRIFCEKGGNFESNGSNKFRSAP